MFAPLLVGAVLFGRALLTGLPTDSPTPIPAPPGYERAVDRLPARYWMLVRNVQFSVDGSGYAFTSGMIVVPRKPRSIVLWHETMHQVWYANPAIAEDWTANFWRRGRPIGKPETDRGRDGPPEDFAEAARVLLGHGELIDQARETWLRERVFTSDELTDD